MHWPPSRIRHAASGFSGRYTSLAGLTEADLLKVMGDDDEHLRAWAVRLLCERTPVAESITERLAVAARGEASPLVRLHLASALQRLPVAQRWELAAALLSHEADQHDPNIPLMIWYGVEPLVRIDRERFVQLASAAKIPLVRRHIARRITSEQP